MLVFFSFFAFLLQLFDHLLHFSINRAEVALIGEDIFDAINDHGLESFGSYCETVEIPGVDRISDFFVDGVGDADASFWRFGANSGSCIDCVSDERELRLVQSYHACYHLASMDSYF